MLEDPGTRPGSSFPLFMEGGKARSAQSLQFLQRLIRHGLEMREPCGDGGLLQSMESGGDVLPIPDEPVFLPELPVGAQGLHEPLDGGRVEEHFAGGRAALVADGLEILFPAEFPLFGGVFGVGIVEEGGQIVDRGAQSHALEVDPEAVSVFYQDIRSLEVPVQQGLGTRQQGFADLIGLFGDLIRPEFIGVQDDMEEMPPEVVPLPLVALPGEGRLEGQGIPSRLPGAGYMETRGLPDNLLLHEGQTLLPGEPGEFLASKVLLDDFP